MDLVHRVIAMRTINIHEAKTTPVRGWSRKRPRGESFVIAKAGKPMVKVVALDAPAKRKPQPTRISQGQLKVPDDFDRMYEDEIQALFEGAQVKLLLDTHVLLWASSEPQRLSRRARDAASRTRANILVVQRGQPLGDRDQACARAERDFDADPRIVRRGAARQRLSTSFRCSGEHAVAVVDLPPIHRRSVRSRC